MSTSSKKSFATILFAIYLVAECVWAQHGEDHHSSAQTSDIVTEEDKVALQVINEGYIKSVKPIFAVKCFSCHATTNNPLPWYSKLPFVGDLIETDITEAKEHMDMTNDFPFRGHGTPVKDLEAIRTELTEGKMPPARYWMIHWKSRITGQEFDTIRAWTLFGEEKLKKGSAQK